MGAPGSHCVATTEINRSRQGFSSFSGGRVTHCLRGDRADGLSP